MAWMVKTLFEMMQGDAPARCLAAARDGSKAGRNSLRWAQEAGAAAAKGRTRISWSALALGPVWLHARRFHGAGTAALAVFGSAMWIGGPSVALGAWAAGSLACAFMAENLLAARAVKAALGAGARGESGLDECRKAGGWSAWSVPAALAWTALLAAGMAGSLVEFMASGVSFREPGGAVVSIKPPPGWTCQSAGAGASCHDLLGSMALEASASSAAGEVSAAGALAKAEVSRMLPGLCAKGTVPKMIPSSSKGSAAAGACVGPHGLAMAMDLRAVSGATAMLTGIARDMAFDDAFAAESSAELVRQMGGFEVKVDRRP
jgi:hypothetical protein